MKYEKNKVLEFPDFNVKYIGERFEEIPNIARGGFFYEDFEISKDNKSKTVSWTSGTGNIGPEYFKFNEQEYVLEISASILQENFLENNEMVIWEKEEYEKK